MSQSASVLLWGSTDQSYLGRKSLLGSASLHSPSLRQFRAETPSSNLTSGTETETMEESCLFPMTGSTCLHLRSRTACSGAAPHSVGSLHINRQTRKCPQIHPQTDLRREIPQSRVPLSRRLQCVSAWQKSNQQSIPEKYLHVYVYYRTMDKS